MSAITAIVQVAQVDRTLADGQVRLRFHAPYSDAEGNRINEEWAKYTPALTLEMVVVSDVAVNFNEGDQFLLTFEKRNG